MEGGRILMKIDLLNQLQHYVGFNIYVIHPLV